MAPGADSQQSPPAQAFEQARHGDDGWHGESGCSSWYTELNTQAGRPEEGEVGWR